MMKLGWVASFFVGLITAHASLLTVEIPARVVKVEANRLLVKFKTKSIWVEKDKVEPSSARPGDVVRVVMDGAQLAGAQ